MEDKNSEWKCACILKGYIMDYGVKNNCNLKGKNQELCNECIKYAKPKSDEYFDNFEIALNKLKNEQIGVKRS